MSATIRIKLSPRKWGSVARKSVDMQQRHAASTRPELPCGCVSSTHCVPPGSTIVFVGDSLTRYQYLDLVFTLRYGHRAHENRTKRNPLNERTWWSWTRFHRGTHAELRPHETVCDCHRPALFNMETAKNTTENRMFQWPRCNVRVAYIQAFGSALCLRGHWPLQGKLWNWSRGPLDPQSAEWNRLYSQLSCLDWPTALRNIVSRMEPTAIILNAGGHWSISGLNFTEIRSAAAEVSRCVVWKTTTTSRLRVAVATDDAQARQAFARDLIFEAGLLTARMPNLHYWDAQWGGVHFTPRTGAYHALNVGLIETLREARCRPST